MFLSVYLFHEKEKGVEVISFCFCCAVSFQTSGTKQVCSVNTAKVILMC